MARDRWADYFEHYNIGPEWEGILENYIIHGFHPGGFFEALFSNDFLSMAMRTHPSNTWSAIATTGKWLKNYAPVECYGSPKKVEAWLKQSDEYRRSRCEACGLLPTVWQILSDP